MKYPFKFDVSLRITHPKMSPEEICKTLGLKAKHKGKVGMPRKTPKGTSLEGVYEYTYCTFGLKHPQKIGLEEFLKSCNEKFYKHKEYFDLINSTGGKLEYFIGWFFDRSSGETFDLELLRQLADLGIELGLNVYGGDW